MLHCVPNGSCNLLEVFNNLEEQIILQGLSLFWIIKIFIKRHLAKSRLNTSSYHTINDTVLGCGALQI